MEADLSIINCSIVRPNGIIEAGIAIKDGKIVSIARNGSLPKARKTINASENFVIPGLIDNHTHIYPTEDGIRKDTGAAVCGGVTTIGIFLGIGSPKAIESYEKEFAGLKNIYEQNSLCDFVFHACMCSDKHIEEIPLMAKKLGITSFKFFMAYKGDEGRQLGIQATDDGALYYGFTKIAELGYPARAYVHAENIDIILRLKKNVMEKKKRGLKAWAEARPNFVEALDIERAISLAKVAGAPIYIVHVSAEESVDIIEREKALGLDLKAETTPAYLTLSNESEIGVLAKVNPALKDRKSLARLWTGLQDGTIDCMGTDHSSAARKEMKKEIWSARPGFPGIETYLPLMLSEGVNKGRLTLQRLVQVACENNAKVLGIYPQKGVLEVGSDADVVILDLKKKKRILSSRLHHIADFCVHEGWEVKGWPILTVAMGEVVMENGELRGKLGKGRYLSRSLEKGR